MEVRLLIVTSDAEMSERFVAAVEQAGVSSISVARTGADCLGALDSARDDQPLTVVVDASVTDLSPLNLVGAISSRRPDVGVVFCPGHVSDEIVQRAMLAGARAVVHRDRIEVDLVPVVKRVSVTGVSRGDHSAGDEGPGQSGNIIVVTGAKGGAGRTTVAIALAWAAASRGVDVGLLDLDLQFGDISFVLNVNPDMTLVDMVRDLAGSPSPAKTFGTKVREGLTLYCPAPQPEQAELVAPRVGQVLQRLRGAHELVVVNTGAFWTLLHAELLEKTDLALMITEQSALSTRATVQAKALGQKLGIPDARMIFVMNRHTQRGSVSVADAAAALRVSTLATIPDGGNEVVAYADAGDIEGLFASRSQVPRAVEGILQQCYDTMGASLPAPHVGRRRGLFSG